MCVVCVWVCVYLDTVYNIKNHFQFTITKNGDINTSNNIIMCQVTLLATVLLL